MMASDIKIISRDMVRSLLPKRPEDAHKGTMGTLLSITGSVGMAGAAVLSLKGALRSGAGLVHQACLRNIYPIIASSVYEAVYDIFDETNQGTFSEDHIGDLLELSEKCDAVLIGCGCRNNDDIRSIVEAFVSCCEKPVLIDADGINALSKDISILKSAKSRIILTPHVMEMSRLSGFSKNEILSNREDSVKRFTDEYENTVLVLKGHDTLVGKKDTVLMNPTGNAGMARGGSGDVLSGITASLCAQRIDPFDAAVCGVYVHGLAGDILKDTIGETAMLPGDIPDYLSAAFLNIQNN